VTAHEDWNNSRTTEFPRTILVAHNRYQQPGGEDLVFASEAALLEQKGHRVIRHEDDNSRIEAWGAGAAVNAVWSFPSHHSIKNLVRESRAEVVHFHNTFPLISPAAYYAAQSEGAAVVQTLHNFRLLCPGATLFRDGAVCEECVERKSLRPAMAHKCYRGSRAATAAVATMLGVHRAAGTWRRKVDLYIALSEFARRKFIEGGVPESRIVVKPNFVSPDPGVGEGRGGYALFVGRLSAEKGISVLASAWRELPDIPLVVAGDGPLAGVFEAEATGRSETGKMGTDGTVHPAHEGQDVFGRDGGRLGTVSSVPIFPMWIGRQSREQVLALMREARVLIFPSLWYEGAPMTIVEAFACGLPVIASNLGSMAEMVAHEKTGLLFAPGDAVDLARKVRWAFDHPEAMETMRAAARREFEERYTAERNYKMLMAIYEMAMANAKRERRAAS
jgi:glycosyltransferase involved in cell wall biosynthesis